MNGKVVLSSRVWLERNFDDIPFDTSEVDENQELCVQRVQTALMMEGALDVWEQKNCADMTDDERRELLEKRILDSRQLSKCRNMAIFTAANGSSVITVGGGVHLQIQKELPGMQLQECAADCFATEDMLSRELEFAFDERLGYLTAAPAFVGTGMGAELLLHLPAVLWHKQMDAATDIADGAGLRLQPAYGQGTNAAANVYALRTRVTLGCTEQEVLDRLLLAAQQIVEKELELREQGAGNVLLADHVYRCWAILSHARHLEMKEFFHMWSAIRLGWSLGLLEGDPGALDDALCKAQPASVRAAAARNGCDRAEEVLRAELVREAAQQLWEAAEE